jgi:hypothetical protein
MVVIVMGYIRHLAIAVAMVLLSACAIACAGGPEAGSMGCGAQVGGPPCPAAAPPAQGSVGGLCDRGAGVFPLSTSARISSPFARIPFTEGTDGLFLFDTGAVTSVIERPFAERLKLAPSNNRANSKCAFLGHPQLGPAPVESDFAINGHKVPCVVEDQDSAFEAKFDFIPFGSGPRVPAVHQNGIIAVDWLIDRTMAIDYERRRLLLWDEEGWKQCADEAHEPHYESVKVARIPGVDAQVTCVFSHRDGAGCGFPFVMASLKWSNQIVDFPLMIDTGRETEYVQEAQRVTAPLVTVNASLLAELRQKGAVGELPSSDNLNHTIALRAPTVFSSPFGSMKVTNIEIRHGAYPYDRPTPMALSGTGLFDGRRNVIFDPFRERILIDR